MRSLPGGGRSNCPTPATAARRLRRTLGAAAAALFTAALRPAVATMLTVLALCASGCGAAAQVRAPVAPPGTPPLIVGVVANTLDAGPRMRAQQTMIRALGVRWIREELRWNVLEPQPGTFRWRSFDRLLESAAREGLHVLPMLIGTPSWAGRTPLALPDDPWTFGAFAGQAAARYGPGGTFWRQHAGLDSRLAPQWFELWNEPYTTAYSQGGVDPAAYAHMVVAASTDARAANPRTRWLMAADLYYGPDSSPRNWLAAMYAAVPNLNDGFDGVAVHPYSFYAPTAGASAARVAFRFARLGAIASELAAHGAARRPIWITELGWSTCDLRPDCVSDHDQAQRLADAFTLVRTRYVHTVKALFVYHLRDFSSGLPDDREAHYGLLRANATRKPSWALVAAEARLASR